LVFDKKGIILGMLIIVRFLNMGNLKKIVIVLLVGLAVIGGVFGLRKVLDDAQQRKNESQVEIYLANMQDAISAGRGQDALFWCEKLKPLARDNSLVLNEIALVYYNNANYEEAEPLYKRALALNEASFGKDHPEVATNLNNLAELYRVTNRLAEAEPLIKRALAIDEASFGKDHPKVATRLNNLAALYYATNRLAEAEPLYKRALEIYEKSLGKDHPNVGMALNNLALLY